MELKYLEEFETIAFCFNNLKETAFILYKQKTNNKIIQPNNLCLIEQEIQHKIIRKRFKLIQRDECNIISKNYRKYPKNCYEGYYLYFWQQAEKLFLIYPVNYIIIYDYNTSDLLYHFQYPGAKLFSSSTLKTLKNPFKTPVWKNYYCSLTNIIGSPIENCLFLFGENINYIYCLDYSDFNNENIKINDLFSKKIHTPIDTRVFDIILHPYEKFLYVGYSDGIVRIYDYRNLRKIKELTNTLFDSSETNNNIIKEKDPVISLDINNIGSYLLEGTERGNIYLWDASLANKNKKIMYKKEFQEEGIFTLKFIKTKQFENIQKFICLSKRGTIIIYFIIAKDDSINQPEGRKKPLIEIVYKNNIFGNPILPNAILKYNIIFNSLINICYNNNIISISWPKFVEIDEEEKSNKNECTLIYEGLISKLFFFFSATYPKINYPLATQLKNRLYEEYIPMEGQPNFQNKIYYADNYYIYVYNISTSKHKKLINYYKELRTKNIYLLKFDVRNMVTSIIFLLLIETGMHRNNLIIVDFDYINDTYKKPKTIYNINDFVILGNSYLNINSDFALLLSRDMCTGHILHISSGNLEQMNIGNNLIRTYHSPFSQGYCVIYRTTKNEFKYSQNFSPQIKTPSEIENGSNNNNNNFNYTNLFNFRCGDLICLKLEKDEYIIDIIFNETSEYYFCAVSMIDKINIYNQEMKNICSLKFNFRESPYIVSSLFFLDCTLIYSKNDSIYYFYPYDNINQLIIRNNRKPIYISGILPDRFLLVSQTSNSNISICDIASPMISPLEPILIGYLDSPSINYDLLKQCVVSIFTNQISQHLIDKLLNKNLKEIAWLFMNDDKSTFQNIDMKINLMNEKFNFGNVIENILVNKNLNRKLDLDDIIWKLNYDSKYQQIKDLLIKELKILIEFGQYHLALKILELLGDYPKAISLLLISTSAEDFDKLKIKFEAREALNFTDNLMVNSLFNFKIKEEKKENDKENNEKNNLFDGIDIGNFIQPKEELNINEEKMQHYHKVFDNYEGEHFIFGVNLNEFNINYIENIKTKVEEKIGPRKKGNDEGIQKRIINFGEKPFNIYTEDFSISKKQNQVIEIYSLVLQKIENYYGIINHLSKNEKEKLKRKMTFYNYNLSLENINSQINTDDNEGINTSSKRLLSYVEDLNDEDLYGYVDDVSEELFLCAYYHCDKGSGEILEDITQNENNAIIKCIYNTEDKNKKNQKKAKKEKKEKKEKGEENEDEEEDGMKNVWSEVLDENRPLEYEDKWGRRSPPPHSIIFSQKLKTKIIINNSNLLQNIEEKFTIEFWIKLHDIIRLIIFTKDSFEFGVDNGLFKLTFKNQEIEPEIIKEYSLSMDTFFHVAIWYKKEKHSINVFLNCEEILKFNVALGVENNTPLIFGNEKLDGEMTEIRIWSQRIPLSNLKENYKSPLSILAENKGKLKMNINMNSRKNTKRAESIFLFGDKNKEKIFGDSSNQFEVISKSSNNNIIISGKIDLSDINLNNDFENTFNDEEYPTMDVVNSQNVNNGDNNFSNQSSSNDLFLQEKDFVFDK